MHDSTSTNPLATSRRAFLGCAAGGLALPWFESLAWATSSSATPQPPTRMAVLFFPNGVWRDSWIPTQEGAGFELPFSLTPLAPVRDEVLVISGLEKKHSHDGDGHYAKTANFLTGLHVQKTTGRDISTGGISMDQLAAKHLGQLTPLPSLELGVDPVISGIDSNVGYTRLYGSHISWQSANRPVAKEIHPQTVFERLLSVQHRDGSDARRQAEHRSLLDVSLQEAGRLRQRLGRDDQFKLDEYLDSVRALEQRIAFFSKPDPRDWHPAATAEELRAPGAPRSYAEHTRLMLDLMVLAFRLDATRISTFMFANDVSGRNFSFVDGVHGAHHELSHHEHSPEKIEQYQRIVRWHVEVYAELLQKLASVPEGEGNLLQHSMVLMGCGMSDGNAHDPRNLPILLGGRAHGTLTPGRHLASPMDTPLSNLYVGMLRRMGVPCDQFGDSTAELGGLTA